MASIATTGGVRAARLMALVAAFGVITAAGPGCGDAGNFVPPPAGAPPPPGTFGIVAGPIPDAIQGRTYGHELVAIGGVEPYAWAVADGALPSGITIEASPAGTSRTALAGTPLGSGTFSFTLEVRDARGARARTMFTLVIHRSLALLAGALPRAMADRAYAISIPASGATPQGYAWTVTAGALPPGLALAPSGTPATALSGTPTAAGSFDFTIEVTHPSGARAVGDFSILVDPTLVVTTAALANGFTGASYAVSIGASGGTDQGFAWSVAQGPLPPGLALGASGTPATSLSGLPGATGSFPFTVEVMDSLGRTATRDLALAVFDPLSIDTLTLPRAVSAGAFTAPIQGSGGTGADFAWAVTAGALPPGLALGASGAPATALSGTPTAAGTFDFTVELTDPSGSRATRDFQVLVDPTLAIDTVALAGGFGDVPYSATIAASGGTGQGYAWTVTAGALPAGLALAASGTPATALSGTPGADGGFGFTAEVTDSLGRTARRDFTLAIAPALAITTTALPAGLLSTPYSADLAATGGAAAGYAWSIVSGALPTGLTLGAAGTPATAVSGTPTAFGIATFTARVTDPVGGQDERALSIDIDPPLRVALAALPKTTLGEALTPIGILASGGSEQGYQWSVVAGALPSDVTVDPAGTPGTFLRGTPSVTGAFVFTLEARDSLGRTATGRFTLAVRAPHAFVATASDELANDRFEAFAIDIRGAAPVSTRARTTWGANADVQGEPLISPDGRKYAFRADLRADNEFDLYIVDLTTSPPSQAVQASANPVAGGDVLSAVRWTPDSRRLVFAGDLTVNGQFDLYAVDVSGAAPGPTVRLTNFAANRGLPALGSFPLAVSDDSTFLAFPEEDLVTGTDVLFAVDLTAGAPVAFLVSGPLPNPAADTISTHVFVPSTRRLCFVGPQDTAGMNELYLVDLDEPAPRTARKLNGPLDAGGDVLTGALQVAPSPSGGSVAFLADARDTIDELYVAEISGPLPGPAVRLNALLPAGRDVASFRWSPDSDRIAYAADEVTNDVFELFVVSRLNPGAAVKASPTPVAGGDVVATLASFGNPLASTDYLFAPDGARLAFRGDLVVNDVVDLFVFDTAAGTPGIRLSTSNLAGRAVFELLWSPDGQRLAFRGDQLVNDRDDLFVTAADGASAPALVNDIVGGNAGPDVESIATDGGWSRDGTYLYYRGDQEVNGVDEAFRCDVSGLVPAPTERLNGVPVAGGDVTALRPQD